MYMMKRGCTSEYVVWMYVNGHIELLEDVQYRTHIEAVPRGLIEGYQLMCLHTSAYCDTGMDIQHPAYLLPWLAFSYAQLLL